MREKKGRENKMMASDGKRGRWSKEAGERKRGAKKRCGWDNGGRKEGREGAAGSRGWLREKRKEGKLHQSAAGHRNASDRNSQFQSRQILPPIFRIFGRIFFLYIYIYRNIIINIHQSYFDGVSLQRGVGLAEPLLNEANDAPQRAAVPPLPPPPSVPGSMDSRAQRRQK